MFKCVQVLLAVLAFVHVAWAEAEKDDEIPVNSIPLKLFNLAGAPIELFWKNTFQPEEELVLQTSKPIRNGTDTVINSYEGHVFVIKFFKDKNKVDEQIEFAKLDVAEETTVAYDPNLGFQIRQRTKLDEMTDKIEKALSACDGIRDSLKAECVADRVLGDVLIAQKTHDTAKRYTNRMAARLRNYTCADPNMQTSKPKNVHNMFVNGKNYEVNDMFENDHAKIFTIDNFLTQNECDILMKHGKGRLQRATVAAEDGTSILSNHRRANQATYETHRVASDPLHALYSRILTTANTKSGLNMGPEGQEGFTIIQYDPTDEYTPHCDGSCDASPHVPTGRVATAVLYCVVPEVGGATSFTKADIFVKPKPLMATFFTYYGIEDGRMDSGYTEHSGCPVLEGEKWIAAAWMRLGVDAKHDWSRYDPSGVEIARYDADGSPLPPEDEDEYEEQWEQQDMNGEEL